MEKSCCASCCGVLFAVIFVFGSMAMEGLGIFYMADNGEARKVNPQEGWIALPLLTNGGFPSQNILYTGTCEYTRSYGDYNVNCTYPASCIKEAGANNLILYKDCTCGSPYASGSYAYSYYKAGVYPPEFHCGEIKSNAENIRLFNQGVILLVTPIGATILISLVLICCTACFAACATTTYTKKEENRPNKVHVMTDIESN